MDGEFDRDRDVERDAADVLVRYATGIDSRDWELLGTCFTEDCDADYGDIGHWHGRDEITAWMAASHDALGPTMHRITNVTVETEAGLVRTRCYVHAVIVVPDSATVHAYGWYDDEMVATPAGWKIARRKFTSATTELHPPMG